MAISDDWTINYSAKTVTHSAGATVYTMLAFFQWLATTYAQTAQMDDDYGIQSDTPTVYKWINGWAFGAPTTDYKYLKGGSIEASDGSAAWSNLYSLGSQVAGSQLYLMQNNTEIAPWWSTGNIDILVNVKTASAWIQSDNEAGTPTNGGVWVFCRETDFEYDHSFVDLSGLGRNPVGINNARDLGYGGGTSAVGDIYLQPAATTNFDVGNYVYGVTSGASGRINFVGGGKIYLCIVEGGPFQTSETLNERTSRTAGDTGTTTTNHATTAQTNDVAGFTDVKWAFVQKKYTGGTTAGGPFTASETLTQAVTGATARFAGEVAAEIYVENVSGTPNNTDQWTGGTSGATYTPTGSSAVTTVALDMNNGAGAVPYRVVVNCATRTVLQTYQYLKYIAQHNSATASINGENGERYRSALEGTYTDSKKAPFGVMGGSTFLGARGVWVTNYSVATFSLTDANGTLQNPPSYQKVLASHDNLSGCNVFVAEISGGAVVKNQYTIQSVTSNSITATAAINANKVPQSGVLRVGDTKYTYASFSGSTFSTVSPDPTGATGAFYVPLLDVLADATSEQSDNIIYSADFTIRTVVRKYGFKPFTQDTSFTSTGKSFSPILTTDPQAT